MYLRMVTRDDYSEEEVVCLKCFSHAGPDIQSHHANIANKYTNGTLGWVKKQDTYQEWIGRKKSVLWISGPPGCGTCALFLHGRHRKVFDKLHAGKSVLCAHLIDQLRQNIDPTAGQYIAYSFFDSMQDKQK
jgi:hypothetical protein